MIGREHRQTLDRLGDVLVPAAEGMPSASEAGVGGAGVDRVLAARPDLAEALERILDDVAGQEPEQAVRALDEVALGTVAFVVTGAYYTDTRVRGLIGYPGQTYEAERVLDVEDFRADGMLDRVQGRGPIYRRTQ